MRSPAEIRFRLRQEMANVLLLAFPPKPGGLGGIRAPLASLPDPRSVAGAATGTEWAECLIRRADRILAGHIPLIGCEVPLGVEPAWRRDWLSGIETPLHFFRRIPYLDASRAGDHKNIWELSRHQHLVLLAQAWLLTGDPRYRDYVIRQLRHWFSENPFQRGINWNSALEVAFRALSWIWIWHILGPTMDPAFQQQFLTELHRHACHLEYNLSVYFSPNTHLLGEAVALHAIGYLFPALPGSAKRTQTARQIVKAGLETQVHPDGGYFEQSTYYHVYALDMFLFHHLLEPLPEEPLRRMAEFLASVVAADGSLPFLGDDDGGRFFYPFGSRREFARATLATCSVVFGQDYCPAVSQRDRLEQALWWIGPRAMQNEPIPALPEVSRAFPDSGLVSFRSGGLRLLFDAGPFGPWSGGHSHSDTLGFVLQIDAAEILIDPGTCTYVGDAGWRDYFRGSRAHNTLQVDGRDQADPAGSFRWDNKPAARLVFWEQTPDQDVAEGECSYRGIRHRRRIALSRADGVVHVTDTLEGEGEHDIEQFWHPGDGIAWGEWLRMDPAFEVRQQEGWRSDALGSKRPSAPVIVGKIRCRLPVCFETLINSRAAVQFTDSRA